MRSDSTHAMRPFTAGLGLEMKLALQGIADLIKKEAEVRMEVTFIQAMIHHVEM